MKTFWFWFSVVRAFTLMILGFVLIVIGVHEGLNA